MRAWISAQLATGINSSWRRWPFHWKEEKSVKNAFGCVRKRKQYRLVFLSRFQRSLCSPTVSDAYCIAGAVQCSASKAAGPAIMTAREACFKLIYTTCSFYFFPSFDFRHGSYQPAVILETLNHTYTRFFSFSRCEHSGKGCAHVITVI